MKYIDISDNEIIVPAFDNNAVPVCFFSDDYYVPYLGTAVKSAIDNALYDTNLDIIIFQKGYSIKNKQLITSLSKEKNNISIRFLDIEPFVQKLNVNPTKRVSINCFAKIFCTDEIFSNYDRILVFDSDLLILRDLKELLQTDMKGNAIAAVKEIYLDIMSNNNYHTDERFNYMLLSDYFNELNIDPSDYFNTGVILFDIKKCQKEYIQDKMIEINNSHPNMMYPAQDDFNIIFRNKWTELNSIWNVQNPYSLLAYIDCFPEGYKDLMEEKCIIHFLGKSKPWNDKKMMKSDLFDRYVLDTPWKNIYLERRREYEKSHFWELYIIPKGSIRRKILLKFLYRIKRKNKN